MLIGYFNIFDYECEFTKENEKIKIEEVDSNDKEKRTEITDEKDYLDCLEQLAIWINSPWSQAHERYEISVNCKDAYTQMDESSPTWKCEYAIVGYDMNEALIYGYGNTEEEALSDCKKLFKWLQDEYNKENESF